MARNCFFLGYLEKPYTGSGFFVHQKPTPDPDGANKKKRISQIGPRDYHLLHLSGIDFNQYDLI